MSVPKRELQVRRPRHDVRSTDQISAWVTSDGDQPAWHTAATLVDVSRHGCRLFAQCDLVPYQAVQLIIDLPDTQKQNVAAAEVRWRLTQEDALYEYGLEFKPALDWEFLGELFLTGTLKA